MDDVTATPLSVGEQSWRASSDDIFATCLGPAAFLLPRGVATDPADWLVHVPFAFWCLSSLRPGRCVTLHDPDATMAATLRDGLDQLGRAAESVMSADTDTAEGEGAPVDLLVMGDCADLETARQSLGRWRERLSPRAVILLVGINGSSAGHGNRRLWADLSATHPSLPFPQASGLGVIAAGPEVEPVLLRLLTASDTAQADLTAAYARLGAALVAQRFQHSMIASFSALTGEATALRRERDRLRAGLVGHARDAVRLMLRREWAQLLRRSLRGLSFRAAMLLGRRNLAVRIAQRANGFTSWFRSYRQNFRYGAIDWRGTVSVSVVMPVYKVRRTWLTAAIDSVIAQTYPHWELICIDDGSHDADITATLNDAIERDGRVRCIALDRNMGVSHATNTGIAAARGDYVLFLDHDDLLEPHALARLADAAFVENSDIVYADEAITGERIDDIVSIVSRPAFSHDYYLSHPFVVHPIVIRTRLLRTLGGLDTTLRISQDIDLMLRALEQAAVVTHVPDVLYRWRTSPDSAGHQHKTDVMETTCAIKTAHLHRLGFDNAQVRPGLSFNTFDARFHAAPPGRVLGVIPTRNGVALLQRCIDTVRATTAGLKLALLVIDHELDDPGTIEYLHRIAGDGTAEVLSYTGPFNYSAINNFAVRQRGAPYDHLLFLNNDMEATETGWLHAMLDLAGRDDVGAVGATLLYPHRAVQHAGVVVGLCGSAEHAYKFVPYGTGTREAGYLAGLHATRASSAVTGACMLVRAAAFESAGGFDEQLPVGFNDTDFCLRLIGRGWRVLNSAAAVLIHHKSSTRGATLDGRDPHPLDSALFSLRYADLLRRGDPYFGALLSRDDPRLRLDPGARLRPQVHYRSVKQFLPRPPAARG